MNKNNLKVVKSDSKKEQELKEKEAKFEEDMRQIQK